MTTLTLPARQWLQLRAWWRIETAKRRYLAAVKARDAEEIDAARIALGDAVLEGVER